MTGPQAPPPAAPHPRRPATGVRAGLVLLAAAGLGGVAYLAAAHPPTPDSFYPKCTFHQATGLHCPGCGTGRAAYFALNGRVGTAARYNPFALVLLPLVAVVAVRSAVDWVRGRPARRRLLWSGWIWLLAVALVVYGVMRNLPWPPFNALAPPEL